MAPAKGLDARAWSDASRSLGLTVGQAYGICAATVASCRRSVKVLIAPIARTGATLRREHRPPGFALAAGEAPADAEAVAPADLVLATTAGPNPTARAA
jgi:hypothetical protein